MQPTLHPAPPETGAAKDTFHVEVWKQRVTTGKWSLYATCNGLVDAQQEVRWYCEDAKDPKAAKARFKVFEVKTSTTHEELPFGMKTVTATVGWTKSDLPRYSSFGDGYRPGAEQHTETVSFEVPDSYDAEGVCWILLRATNSPYVEPEDGSPEGNALAAILATGYNGREAHWSLSTGDTVTVDGTMRAFTGYAVEVVAA